MSKAQKPPVDWERIELDYRAGVLSLREIAAAHPGTNHVAIKRRADEKNWTRDLSGKIKAKAEDLLTRSVAEPAVKTETQKQTEAQVIAVNAEIIVKLRTLHRVSIDRSRAVALKLLDELEHTTESQALYVQLGEMLRSPNDNGVDKLNDLYQKAISLPQRIKGMKELADTLKTLIGLEREAWGIDGGRDPADDPKEPADPMEIARRLAFALAKADATTVPSRTLQ